ncbi:hypothetical protein [Aeromicrobium sp. IC_218]|uniref:hypothetical protein n=1 Tax=Aeromicrobium sp. IC_218 TaxID=2545468 RepID=UPI00103C3E96|nr:hypothetical protein [Aeromicrobium sp. IC_218]TCI97783.1 hypothetical protein E0W78_10735 [Aeromicrobium sp. IC_218]
MTPHPPRWGTFTVALVLALVLLGWARWEHDVLDSQDAGLAVAIVLIALGCLGIVATAWRSWPGRGEAPVAPQPDEDVPVTTAAQVVPVEPTGVGGRDDHEPTRTFPTPPEGGTDEQEAHPKP